MKLQLAEEMGWKIEFVYSPFFEMLCSLHVLFKSDHHQRNIEWANLTKKCMTVKLYDELSFFDEVSDGFMGVMEFCHIADEFHSFNLIDAISYIEGLDRLEFAYLILNKEITQSDILKIVTLKKSHLPQLSQSKSEFLIDLEEYRNKFQSLLKEYYYLHFKALLIELEPFLIKTLKGHKQLCESLGILEYISILHPRIELMEDRIALHKYKRFDFMFDEIKKIDIGISSFIDPHLLLGESDGFMSLTIRARRERTPCKIHHDMVATLKVLGDATRMRMIKHLYEKPCSTKELAVKLDISEAGVSKHLKLLYGLKIVNKIRKGNFILYYLEELVIDRIPMNVYQYLDE